MQKSIVLFFTSFISFLFSSLLRAQNCDVYESYVYNNGYNINITLDSVYKKCPTTPADILKWDAYYASYLGTRLEGTNMTYNCHWYAWLIAQGVSDNRHITSSQVEEYFTNSGLYTYLSGATLVNNNYPHPAILLWTGGSDHSAATLNNSK